MSFPPFYFDSNAAAGLIESPSDWARLVTTYARARGLSPRGALTRLLAAERAPGDGPTPSFGLRAEHTLAPNLGAWASKQGINLTAMVS